MEAVALFCLILFFLIVGIPVSISLGLSSLLFVVVFSDGGTREVYTRSRRDARTMGAWGPDTREDNSRLCSCIARAAKSVWGEADTGHPHGT